jgi:hypothetical protein
MIGAQLSKGRVGRTARPFFLRRLAPSSCEKEKGRPEETGAAFLVAGPASGEESPRQPAWSLNKQNNGWFQAHVPAGGATRHPQ